MFCMIRYAMSTYEEMKQSLSYLYRMGRDIIENWPRYVGSHDYFVFKLFIAMNQVNLESRLRWLLGSYKGDLGWFRPESPLMVIFARIRCLSM